MVSSMDAKERLMASVDRKSNWHLRPLMDCWVWIAHRNASGYGTFKIGRESLAHRASWLIHRGAIPAGMVVCHHCDNPPCVNPAHLFLGSRADNSHDRDRKGRTSRQDRDHNTNRKLSVAAASEIRSLISAGVQQKEIAHRYGVSRQTITAVNVGANWREK